MVYNADLALRLVKARLDYMPDVATPRDEYLRARIEATAAQLAENGIHLMDRPEDTLLLVDAAVYDYQCRDKSGAMPEWLRLRLRERFIADRRMNAEGGQKGCSLIAESSPSTSRPT